MSGFLNSSAIIMFLIAYILTMLIWDQPAIYVIQLIELFKRNAMDAHCFSRRSDGRLARSHKPVGRSSNIRSIATIFVFAFY